MAGRTAVTKAGKSAGAARKPAAKKPASKKKMAAGKSASAGAKAAPAKRPGRGRQGRILRLPKALLVNIDNTIYLLEQGDPLWDQLGALLTEKALRPHRLDKKSASPVALTHDDIRKVLAPDFAIRPMKR